MTVNREARLAGLSVQLGSLVPVERLVRPGDPPDLPQRLRANGFSTVSVTTEEPVALAAEAARAALTTSGTTSAEVSAVVYGSCSYWGRSSVESAEDPAPLTLALHEQLVAPLGLRHARLAVVWLAESGNFASVLRFARALFRAGTTGSVLCVVADVVPDGPQEYRAMPNAITINGDAAAACLLTSRRDADWVLEGLSQSSSVPMSGFAKGQGLRKHLEIMKGIRAAASAVYQELGCSGADYRWLVANNYSHDTLAGFADMAGLGLDRVYRGNVARTGHLFSADLVLNLRQLVREGAVRRGDRVLGLSTGPYTWGAVSVRKA